MLILLGYCFARVYSCKNWAKMAIFNLYVLRYLANGKYTAMVTGNHPIMVDLPQSSLLGPFTQSCHTLAFALGRLSCYMYIIAPSICIVYCTTVYCRKLTSRLNKIFFLNLFGFLHSSLLHNSHCVWTTCVWCVCRDWNKSWRKASIDSCRNCLMTSCKNWKILNKCHLIMVQLIQSGTNNY